MRMYVVCSIEKAPTDAITNATDFLCCSSVVSGVNRYFSSDLHGLSLQDLLYKGHRHPTVTPQSEYQEEDTPAAEDAANTLTVDDTADIALDNASEEDNSEEAVSWY